MPHKVIIDCDLGIDDAVALCMLLLDKQLDVIAVTAAEGVVAADQANHNLQAIVTEIDPERHPRLGLASPAEDAPPVDTRFLFGDDGLGNSDLKAFQRQHTMASDKLIVDCARAHPEEVTLLCLGPLTNLARALRREPNLPSMLSQVIMVGGSLTATGNISPCSEFNFYFDPVAAREVLATRMTKSLIPLDILREVTFGLDLMEELPGSETRVGWFLKQIFPFAYRAFRQRLGLEHITLNDAVGSLALVERDLFEFEQMVADVETEGEMTRGMLVLDRRRDSRETPNLSIATRLRTDAAYQQLIDRLVMAGNRSK
jgi:purine nucleosidase